MSYRLSQNESITLDFLRVLASQLVVIGHSLSYFKLLPFLHYPNVPWMQNIAVVFFFILSGYVITYSCNTKLHLESYSFYNYFLDRFFRIFTTFIPAILFVAFLDTASISISSDLYAYDSAFNLKTFFGNLFMLQDIPILKKPLLTSFGSARPFWTIAIEWWIYIFYGSLFFLIKGYKKLPKKNKIILYFIVFLSLRVPLAYFTGGRGRGLFLFWLFGSALFYLLPRLKLKSLKRSQNWIFIGLTVLLILIRKCFYMSAYDKIFAFLLSGLILLLMNESNHWKIKNSTTKWIKFLASYSFSLYLIHYSIADFIFRHMQGTSSWNKFFLTFIISNIISILFGVIFETRLTKTLKVRFNSYRKA